MFHDKRPSYELMSLFPDSQTKLWFHLVTMVHTGLSLSLFLSLSLSFFLTLSFIDTLTEAIKIFLTEKERGRLIESPCLLHNSLKSALKRKETRSSSSMLWQLPREDFSSPSKKCTTTCRHNIPTPQLRKVDIETRERERDITQYPAGTWYSWQEMARERPFKKEKNLAERQE